MTEYNYNFSNQSQRPVGHRRGHCPLPVQGLCLALQLVQLHLHQLGQLTSQHHGVLQLLATGSLGRGQHRANVYRLTHHNGQLLEILKVHSSRYDCKSLLPATLIGNPVSGHYKEVT